MNSGNHFTSNGGGGIVSLLRCSSTANVAMQLFDGLRLSCGTCIAILLMMATNGQYFEDPTQMYEQMEFDDVRRGSYNVSLCINDLINCWEIIKPDMVCSWSYLYESACSLMREYCDDVQGDMDQYLHNFKMFESVCENYTVT